MAHSTDDEDFARRLLQQLDGICVDDDPLTDASREQDQDEAELLAMKSAINSYREHSLDWAKQRSAAMPSPLPRRQTGWLAAPQWALGTAGFCACVIGAALYTHHQAVLVQQAAAVLPAAPTQQALAADNQLLSSVDDALSNSVAPTEQELGLTEMMGRERAQERHTARQRTN